MAQNHQRFLDLFKPSDLTEAKKDSDSFLTTIESRVKDYRLIDKLGMTDSYYGEEGVNFYNKIQVDRDDFLGVITKTLWGRLTLNDYNKLVKDGVIKSNKHIERFLSK